MIRGELPQRESRTRSSAIGLTHRKGENVFAEIGSSIIRRPHVLLNPQQTMSQLHRAAGRIESVAIVVVARNVREDCLQMRITGKCGFPLSDSEVRSAIH